MKDYQQFVIEKRKSLGVSQKELALLLGMKEAGERTVRGWENGEHRPSATRLAKLEALNNIHPFEQNKKISNFTFIDLFAGIGGIRLPFQKHGGKCVFSSEIDKHAQKTYFANYGEYPSGDITEIQAKDIPDHDLLLAGFPCQAFSQAGLKQGFKDTRGTMFFEIQRILAEKRPKMFLLENVKRLRTDKKGETFQTIYDILTGQHKDSIPDDVPMSEESRDALSHKLNYWVGYAVLRAADFGVPQNRERIFIVGFNKDYFDKVEDFDKLFSFPKPSYSKTRIGDILEDVPTDDTVYTISDNLWAGHQKRKAQHINKGNGFGYSLFNQDSEYTNTISARYYKDGSEALIDQSQHGKNPRMLTPRECARLQGFPEDFLTDAVSKMQAYKQFGNSVCVKVVSAVAEQMLLTFHKAEILQNKGVSMQTIFSDEQKQIIELFERNVYGRKPDTSEANQKHDGKNGHWLEKQMGIPHNASNEPDLLGYEMKNTGGSKITFGDWNASHYIFKEGHIDRKQFMEIFGKPNEKKEGRFSWSGSAIANFNSPSTYNGSEMLFDDEKNVVIVYNYSKDPRPNKGDIVPKHLQQEGIIKARWDKDDLKKKLETKFGENGWFKCNTNAQGEYNQIGFGGPIKYDDWIKDVENGKVIFDSGMSPSSSRNRSQWRANNNYWDSLVTDTYPE